jgi:NadR type nicotinamide-nucleotide adenylyltransferase
MRFFSSVISDLKYLNIFERIFLLLFAGMMIVFSFIDFNAIKNGSDSSMSIYKWVNDKNNGKELYEQIIMCTSGIASFTGAMSVIMTAKGLYSLFFWGYINVITYGTYAYVYGYVGDFQLNIMFFLPMMMYGQYCWSKNMNNNIVRMRRLSFNQIILCLIFVVGIGAGFYFEIPEFSKQINGYYIFEKDGISTPHILDASSNGFNIIGQLLLNGRYMEQWISWIIVNCIQISMYAGVAGFGQDINILAMFSLFLVNAIRGLYVWSKANYIYAKKKKGMIIGKFYPFHNGHKYLIETGLENCDILNVVIVYKKDQTISAKDRYKMIYETFQEQISNGKMELQIKEDIYNNDDCSKLWAKLAIEWNDGFKPDIVFTSEKYGEPWAKYIGCLHYLCDLERIKFNISGTIIRSNPYKYWNLLPIATQNYYRIKFVLVGAESVGKSTLCKKISEKLNIPYVEEYAREYINSNENKFTIVDINSNENNIVVLKYSPNDFIKIAENQEKSINNKIKENLDSKAIICDTDGVVTRFWFDRYLNNLSNKKLYKIPKELNKILNIASNEKRIYIFSRLDSNTNFVQDGTRDGENIRKEMDEYIKKFFESNKLNYIELNGPYDSRELEMENIIKNIIL